MKPLLETVYIVYTQYNAELASCQGAMRKTVTKTVNLVWWASHDLYVPEGDAWEGRAKRAGGTTPKPAFTFYNSIQPYLIIKGGFSMALSRHVERHFKGSERVRDIIIGMSDGLTVPFALAAGLSGVANATSNIIITGGLAEMAAGAISMGLGGYLAARSDAEHYQAERATEQKEVETIPDIEVAEVEEVFLSYGLDKTQSSTIAKALSLHPQKWIDFMMKFELGLEKPDPKRAVSSAMTIGLSYIVGGLVPLTPYILIHTPGRALIFSVIFTLVALLIFGYVKGRFSGTHPFRSALQTAVLGGIAAAAAFGLAKLIS
jgi:vacuolar iron transporter family protein